MVAETPAQTPAKTRMARSAKAEAYVVPLTARLMNNRNFLAIWFMLPAAAILLLFLAWPLILGKRKK